MTELFIALGGAGVLVLGSLAVLMWPKQKVLASVERLAEPLKPIQMFESTIDPAPSRAIIDLDALEREAKRRTVEQISERVIEATSAQQREALVAAVSAPKPP